MQQRIDHIISELLALKSEIEIKQTQSNETQIESSTESQIESKQSSAEARSAEQSTESNEQSNDLNSNNLIQQLR